MSVQTRPLAAPFGREIVGFDLEKATDGEIDELRRLWAEQLVLVFRGLDLTVEGQTALAARFGIVGQVANATADMPEADRSVMMISNRRIEGKESYLPDGEMWFHFDQAYLDVPIIAGLLYAVTVPSTGGDTRFANAAAIYEALPERLRARLDGLEAENAYEYSATTQMVGDGEEVASQVHPMVIRHPVTGAPSLFVSPLMTRRVVGVSEEESQQLLGELRLFLERDEFVYEHHWQVGDLVLWDNRCVLHARTDFDPAEARILRRVSLAGQEAPQAYALSAR